MIKHKKISEICKVSRGKVYSKAYVAENKGPYPLYSSQTLNDGILGYIDTYDFEGEYLNWTTDGAHAGTVFYRDGKFSVTNVSGILELTDDSINIKYLYYILQTKTKEHVNPSMGNPKLMSNVMAEIVVPIPPMEVQNEIVRVLDKFSVLEAELEAELEARQSQYEYYRNKLLTFDKNNRGG